MPAEDENLLLGLLLPMEFGWRIVHVEWESFALLRVLWSSSVVSNNTNNAWIVNLNNGNTNNDNRNNTNNGVFCVR
jgi:hypothetical protein